MDWWREFKSHVAESNYALWFMTGANTMLILMVATVMVGEHTGKTAAQSLGQIYWSPLLIMGIPFIASAFATVLKGGLDHFGYDIEPNYEIEAEASG
jgi:hypothetical protein